jgi:hypothetical protein
MRSGEDKQDEIDKLLGARSEPVKEGDEMIFTSVPGTDYLSVNGADKVTIAGPAFDNCCSRCGLVPSLRTRI